MFISAFICLFIHSILVCGTQYLVVVETLSLNTVSVGDSELHTYIHAYSAGLLENSYNSSSA